MVVLNLSLELINPLDLASLEHSAGVQVGEGQHWVHSKVRSGGGMLISHRCNYFNIYDLGLYKQIHYFHISVIQ